MFIPAEEINENNPTPAPQPTPAREEPAGPNDAEELKQMINNLAEEQKKLTAQLQAMHEPDPTPAAADWDDYFNSFK